jgi:hypothetical protein
MKHKCGRNLDKMINLGISQSSRASIFKLKDQGVCLILTQSLGDVFGFFAE